MIILPNYGNQFIFLPLTFPIIHRESYFSVLPVSPLCRVFTSFFFNLFPLCLFLICSTSVSCLYFFLFHFCVLCLFVVCFTFISYDTSHVFHFCHVYCVYFLSVPLLNVVLVCFLFHLCILYSIFALIIYLISCIYF